MNHDPRPARNIPILLALVAFGPSCAAWRPLFNGEDLTGWDKWLGVPHRSVTGVDVPRNDNGDYTRPLGLNADPKNVYTVVTEDGEPAIRISGEIWGALTSREEFENYHLRFEYKWGTRRWPPKDQQRRDSGILYHCVGEQGAHGSSKLWMQSLECQIQEHDTGDFWSVNNAMVDVAGVPTGSQVTFQKGGPSVTVGAPGQSQRAIHSTEADHVTGWNVVEVLTVGSASIHVINGRENMALSNARVLVGGDPRPLHRGKLQLQSEGAEVFYRRITIRPLSRLPATL